MLVNEFNSPKLFIIDLPLFVGGTTKILKNGTTTKPTKKYWLTLNNYRNWHYQIANGTKKKFKELIKEDVLRLPNLFELWDKVHLEYLLYSPDNKKRDLTNSVSIVDKYFADALVELGKLKDDSCSFVPSISCRYMGIDRVNPRMTVNISEFK